ncbi:hypothetical protein VNI00_004736 [Paramarasmius palmivorus]|uniref:Uncharacterized protein n=1 Tax=Paramarasmius palmivorus TaxID=297713 RepID=A0AAW0DHZ5_9AGAR
MNRRDLPSSIQSLSDEKLQTLIEGIDCSKDVVGEIPELDVLGPAPVYRLRPYALVVKHVNNRSEAYVMESTSPSTSSHGCPTSTAPSNFDRSMSNFNRSMFNFNRGILNFNRGISNFDRSTSNFNRRMSNFDRSMFNFKFNCSMFNFDLCKSPLTVTL